MKLLDIAVDFDGAIAAENYPNIGALIIKAKKYMNKWYDQGHTVIVNTCRSGKYQDDAREFLIANGIKFHTINEHTSRQVMQYPIESRKMSADLYIDDRDSRQYVDWDFEDSVVTKLANEKPLIICLLGESGSGKTTLAEHIEREFGIVMIQSHTDRAKRTPVENGHTFHTKEEFDKLDIRDMLAYVNFGDKQYCCLKSDLKRKNTYVIDESGLLQLDASLYNIVAIKVYCTKKERNKRVGKERTDRDKGKFSFFRPWMLWFSRYDYYVNTGKSKSKCRARINKIINRIREDY